ncbi:HAD family hydrolase [Vibrio sp. LaRot3]|uniref:HAD family hydrolase n=1 Tax=Vibrio sp. LaRot3 TaxID=2998829 RepID=UPI0022CDF7C8|nr:HAD family hydrolase [Vibrio sp. LaRot3]MDA0150216.1 HAD-IB family hydrolase [Vibrio sp. LaRot3]
MPKPLYLFDLDETLIDGDCAMIWNQFLVAKGYVDDPEFLEKDAWLMAQYAQGELDMQQYLRFAMQPLANLSKSEVDDLVTECVDTRILPLVFPQAAKLIQQLKNDHIDMIVISASVSLLVHQVAQALGVSESIGIDLEVKNGCYTDSIIGVPSYREGKVARLNQWCKQQPKQYGNVHFFTDSINDLPMCEAADFTYLVNPCPQLKAVGQRINWVTLDWGRTSNT